MIRFLHLHKKGNKMKFKATHNNGFVIEERATGFASFWNEILPIMVNGEESNWVFLLDGKEVSYDVIQKSCLDSFKAWKAKKALTHKKVRISVGATNLPNTYKSVWIKK